MKTFSLLLVLTCLISRTTYSQSKEDNNSTSVHKDWKSLIEQNYSINYPENWELNGSGVTGTAFFLFSPKMQRAPKCIYIVITLKHLFKLFFTQTYNFVLHRVVYGFCG